MKIKLKQDQYYIAVDGGKYFGKKGDIINVCPIFAKLIRDKYELVKTAEPEQDEPKKEKPLDKMNKAELITYAQKVGADYTDDEFEAMTKAELTKIIVDIENKK